MADYRQGACSLLPTFRINLRQSVGKQPNPTESGGEKASGAAEKAGAEHGISEGNKMQTIAVNAGPQVPEIKSHPESRPSKGRGVSQTTAFGCPRDFLDNHFVYVTVSARARGLSVGVNMNPDKECNFDCVYCEVDRQTPFQKRPLDINAMSEELQSTLASVHSGEIRLHPPYDVLPGELLKLRNVALSGDGEPTLCPNFAEAVQSVVHVRARGSFPFYKIVLITNATGLDLPDVEQSLKLLTPSDEIWAKLDAGTQAYMDKVNHAQVSLKKVLANI